MNLFTLKQGFSISLFTLKTIVQSKGSDFFGENALKFVLPALGTEGFAYCGEYKEGVLST